VFGYEEEVGVTEFRNSQPGELLGEKEKAWVKTHLREEEIFMLKNYMSTHSRA
jgi:hypothetical protein